MTYVSSPVILTGEVIDMPKLNNAPPDRAAPVSFRPTHALRSRLYDYCERTGRQVSAVITEALDKHLQSRKSPK